MTAVLLAAGSSHRMKMDINKVYLSLDAHSIPALHYPLAALDQNQYVDEIVIVVRRDDRPFLIDIINHEKFPKKPVWVALGGERRSDSVLNGVKQANGEIVLIHDGARPLLKQRYITSCIQAMDHSVGAIIGIKCLDAIWAVDETGCLTERKEQSALYQAQTPQCFHKDVLLECYRRVGNDVNVTDDSSLLELCGHKVKLLPGEESNLKLTVPSDVVMAEQYIRRNGEIQSLL